MPTLLLDHGLDVRLRDPAPSPTYEGWPRRERPGREAESAGRPASGRTSTVAQYPAGICRSSSSSTIKFCESTAADDDR
jgi:hypothetical protein